MEIYEVYDKGIASVRKEKILGEKIIRAYYDHDNAFLSMYLDKYKELFAQSNKYIMDIVNCDNSEIIDSEELKNVFEEKYGEYVTFFEYLVHIFRYVKDIKESNKDDTVAIDGSMLGDISRIIYLDMVDYYLNNREIEFNEKKDLLKKFQSVISVDYLTRLFLAYGMNAIKEVDSSLNIDQKALEFMCHFPFELTMVQLCKSFDDKIEKEEKAELESMIDKKKVSDETMDELKEANYSYFDNLLGVASVAECRRIKGLPPISECYSVKEPYNEALADAENIAFDYVLAKKLKKPNISKPIYL